MSAVRAVTGKYAHECSEFDDLLIDETCTEFAYCRCFQPTPEILAIQDKINIHLDSERGTGSANGP